MTTLSEIRARDTDLTGFRDDELKQSARDRRHLLGLVDELAAVVRRYASECGECNGSGRIVEYDKALYIGQLCSPIGDSECEACADIRATLAKVQR